mmetsp:Transcript_14174/g.38177  ORF Transcript_14174/g.38177 Transcript_14174/m.38177 type:complete len:128 (-) Transcript_14174:59-442(-)
MSVRLLDTKPHSCTVERVCSMHKLVTPKIRNRLKHRTIQMLLYCYLNMRLIQNCKDEDVILNFLESALEDENVAEAVDEDPAAASELDAVMQSLTGSTSSGSSQPLLQSALGGGRVAQAPVDQLELF